MIALVEHQRLAYVATVRPDGTPAVSPKATLAVLDRERLVFADLRSPGTVDNVRENPAVEVNVVDPLVRKGWRFAGRAHVLDAGPEFERLVAWFGERTIHDAARRVRSVVVIRVTSAEALVSPGYDLEDDEGAVRARWTRYYLGDGSDPDGPAGGAVESGGMPDRHEASPGIVIVVTMTVRADAAATFETFERTAARVMRRYGGFIARAVREPGREDGTFREVHVVTFPVEAALAAYRADEEMKGVAGLRAASVLHTETVAGQDIDYSSVSPQTR